MATRGRKPKPTRLKKLAGNPGKRPLNTSEPSPAAKRLPTPRGKLPEEAIKFWRKFAPVLADLGILTEADAGAFEMMAVHYALAVEAYQTIKREGITVLDRFGQVRKHPAAQIFRDNSTAFRMYAEQFGMSPSARGRLSIKQPEEQDELAELMFRRKVSVGDGR